MRHATTLFVLFISATVVAACSTGGNTSTDRTPPPVTGDAGPDPDPSDAGPDVPDTRPPPTGMPDPLSRIWVNTPRELFSFDPQTRLLTEVGAFSEGGVVPASITDLAVDGEGNLWAASFHTLFRVDTTTAELTRVGDFDQDSVRMNAMSFVAAGLLDPLEETLVVVATNGDYYRVDDTNAHLVPLGTVGPEYLSSGDLVSVGAASTTYAAAQRPGDDMDVLVEFDLATGEMAPVGVDIGHDRIYGMAYHSMELFGFTCDGDVLLIDLETGVGTPLDHAAERCFWGAAVSTAVPLI